MEIKVHTPDAQQHRTWGLVLSGGAAAGIANGGVLEALEEHNLCPDYIAGSSMGAIVGALYALGHTPSTLRSLVKEIKFSKLIQLSDTALQNGLHSGLFKQGLEHHLSNLIGEAKISDCNIPFVCIAGRVKEPIQWRRILTSKKFTEHTMSCVEPYVFPPDTLVIDAILASSAIPVLFSPMKIGNDEFIDLCNFGTIPARTLRKIHHPDIIIATDTSPHYLLIRKILPASWRSFLDDGNKSLEKSKAACDLIIKPEVRSKPHRFDQAENIYERGKEATEKNMEKIQALLKSDT